MGPFAVVDPQPGLGRRPQLRHRLKEMRVEDLRAVRAIEPFDVRVLIRFAGLNVLNRHALVRERGVQSDPVAKTAAMSQHARPRIEPAFGWLKTIAWIRKVKLRSLEKVEWLVVCDGVRYSRITSGASRNSMCYLR